MSRRLGEILVAAGKITEAQLHRALTAQLVFGGHLGTGLLELGVLDEESLGETLSKVFGVPYADADLLSRIPYGVVRSLPARLVQKHKVVPLRLEGRTLHLAMIDPKNILAVDEISFVTGYRIVPWVSPEVRVLEALEQYYEIARAPRFATLTRELSRLPSRRDKIKPHESESIVLSEAHPRAQAAPLRVETAAASAAPTTVPPPAIGRFEPPNTPPVATHRPAPDAGPPLQTPAPVVAHSAGRPPRQAPAPAVAPGPATTTAKVENADPWEKYGYGRSWREVAAAFDEMEPDGTTSEEADTKPQPRDPEGPVSLMTASRRLAEAGSVEEVVEATLAYASARLARCAFFVVKGGSAVAWSGRGWGASPPSWGQTLFPLDEGSGSIFTLVPKGAAHFLGPVNGQPWAAGFYRMLGAPHARTALLVSVPVKGRTAAYLYGDGADRDILAIDVPSLTALCGRAGYALQIMILRNKILAP